MIWGMVRPAEPVPAPCPVDPGGLVKIAADALHGAANRKTVIIGVDVARPRAIARPASATHRRVKGRAFTVRQNHAVIDADVLQDRAMIRSRKAITICAENILGRDVQGVDRSSWRSRCERPMNHRGSGAVADRACGTKSHLSTGRRSVASTAGTRPRGFGCRRLAIAWLQTSRSGKREDGQAARDIVDCAHDVIRRHPADGNRKPRRTNRLHQA